MSELGGVPTMGSIDYSIELSRGLGLLRQAYQYAKALDRSEWDFAVELAILHGAGMSNSDLRWLLCLHYIEHAEEVTGDSLDERHFQPGGYLRFSNRSCFVLTESGMDYLDRLMITDLSGHSLATPSVSLQSESIVLDSPQNQRPLWDCQRRELRMGNWVIKRYKLPSPNQETLLAAFEEEGWPLRIDDPLPPVPGVISKRRLHDTIKSLNRNQKCRLISFKGDGTGEGICWAPFRPNSCV